MKCTIRHEHLLYAAGLFATAMLATAFVAQYGFELHPCELCIYQRYPYGFIVFLAIIGVALKARDVLLRALLYGCIALFLADAGIAFYHAMVELGWLAGPDACSTSAAGDNSLEAMRRAIMEAPLVSCPQAMVHVFGLSLAAWNGIAASIAALSIIIAMRRA